MSRHPHLKRLAFLLLSLSGLSAAAAPPSGHVVAVRRSAVYISLGAADGVRAGDTLPVEGGAGHLQIETVGAHQSMGKRSSGARIRVGDVVVSLRLPPKATAQEALPVKRLPAGDSVVGDAAEALWARPEAGVRQLIVYKSGDSDPGQTQISGDLSIYYVGILDPSDRDLDLHLLRARSRLSVEGLAHGHLDYEHDINGRLDLGPNLSTRSGAESRPYYELRRAALRYRSNPDLSAQDRAGSVAVAVGRVTPAAGFGAGMVDGGQVTVALPGGVALDALGGLLPDLLDTGFSTDSVAGGGQLSWGAEGPDWTAWAALSGLATTFAGDFNRLDATASLGGSFGRLVDFSASAVLGYIPYDTGIQTSGAHLIQGFAALRVKPLHWLTVDLWHSHFEEMGDRELTARIGLDSLIGYARESSRLGLRFSPLGPVDIWVSGAMGYLDKSAEQWSASTRIVWRPGFFVGSRLGVNYRLSTTRAMRVQQADLRLSVPLGGTVDVGLGYGLGVFVSRLLQERELEHRGELTAGLLLPGAFRAHLSAAVAGGDLPTHVALTALFSWGFR